MILARMMQRTLFAACWTMCLLASGHSLAAVATEAEASDPMTAIWQLKRVEFNYRSANIYYSCEGLQHKIRSILTAIGARKDVIVDVRCRAGGLTNDANMLITLATPIEASVENVTAATTYSSETQLVARLKNVQLPTSTDLHRFPAEWRKVELNRNMRLNLGAGDCELLQGLIRQVFPHLSVRVAKQRLNCSMGNPGRVRPVLHVAALMPSPVVPLAYAPARQ
jgi:hypothetical protein